HGPTAAARDDLTGGQPDEFTVGGEISLPQLAWLHCQTPGPLQPQHLQPTRSPLDEARQHVEAAADSDDDRHIKAATAALAPSLLEGAGHAAEQHVCRAGPDLLDDARVVVRSKVAVPEASDFKARVLGLAALHEFSDDVVLGAEKIDAQPVLTGCRQKTRH